MAETTGLLNRRTGHSVPRVRISSSPLKSLTERSVRDFWFIAAKECPIFAENVSKKVARRRVTFGEEKYVLFPVLFPSLLIIWIKQSL